MIEKISKEDLELFKKIWVESKYTRANAKDDMNWSRRELNAFDRKLIKLLIEHYEKTV